MRSIRYVPPPTSKLWKKCKERGPGIKAWTTSPGQASGHPSGTAYWDEQSSQLHVFDGMHWRYCPHNYATDTYLLPSGQQMGADELQEKRYFARMGRTWASTSRQAGWYRSWHASGSAFNYDDDLNYYAAFRPSRARDVTITPADLPTTSYTLHSPPSCPEQKDT